MITSIETRQMHIAADRSRFRISFFTQVE
jgi:hypothetical protein